MIIAATSLALIAILSQQNSTASRISDVADAQTVSAVYEQDVQSALSLTTSPSPSNASTTSDPSANPMAQCGTGKQLLGLEWNLNQATHQYENVVSYDEVANGSTNSLVRQSCNAASATPSTPTSTTYISTDIPTGEPPPTVAGSNLTSGTQIETVNADKLVITSTAFTAAALNSATTGFTVTLENGSGAATTSSSATTVGLSSTSSGAEFAASSGGAAVTNVTLLAGQSAVTAYYGDTAAGTPTIMAAGTGLTSGTQTETITAATSNKLVITSTAFTATASSSATNAFTIALETSSGASTTSTSATTVDLLSSSSGAEFAGSSRGTAVTSVTLPAGQSSVTAYYGDTVADAPTITVVGVSPSTGVQMDASASQTETVKPGTATQLAITSPAFTAAVWGTATNAFTVTQEDSFGNPTPSTSSSGTTVGLSESPLSGAEFAASSGGTAVTSVSIAYGQSSVTAYFGDNAAGIATITTSGSGLTSGTQAETINAYQLVITPPAFTAAASYWATSAFTVTLENGSGAATTSSSATTVGLSSTSSGAEFAQSSGGAAVTSVTLPANTSSVTAYYGDTVAGKPTITVAGTGLTSGTQTVTITAATSNQLVITSTAFAATASSSATSAFTVTLENSSGMSTTDSSATTVDLSSSSSGAEFAASSGGTAVTSLTVTLPAGQSSVTAYYGDTVAGNPTLTAAASPNVSPSDPNSKNTAATVGWTSAGGVTGVTFATTEPGSGYSYSLDAVPRLSASTSQLSGLASSATATSCGFAATGTATYASTLCFVDFSNFNDVEYNNATSSEQAKYGVCQTMTAGIVGTPDTLSFCLRTTTTGGDGDDQAGNLLSSLMSAWEANPTGQDYPYPAVVPWPIPTYFDPPTSEAFLGDDGFYTGIPGNPALYENDEGSTANVYITNIKLTDSNGNAATDWDLVTGDAESTDRGESMTWTSDQDLNLLPNSPTSQIGNTCADPTSPDGLTPQSVLSGQGALSVTCASSVNSDKTGTVMLAALQPTMLTVSMVGAGLEAIFLGVLLP
jgi:hypothetical protein